MNSLTIFTPTYNRKDKLKRLYNSLVCQDDKNFTWLIVDDGSNDDTNDVVAEWKKESLIEIKYVFQENQGKHMAYNTALDYADSYLFVCVDSDDTVVKNFVSTIYSKDISNTSCVGMLFKKININGEEVTKFNCSLKQSTLYDAYHFHGLKGDTMLVFKTNLIKEIKFPKFDNEKFFPEAYIYDKIDKIGFLKFYDESLYICEYLENGYSANIHSLNARNPKAYITFAYNRLLLDKKFKFKFQDAIRIMSIAFVLKKQIPNIFNIIGKNISKFIFFISYIPAFIRYYKIYKD